MLTRYCKGDMKRVQIWPVISNINQLTDDTNKLINIHIDIVFALGGDGTLLSLLRALYKFYSHVELPRIAAFNYGSMGYLCNF